MMGISRSATIILAYLLWSSNRQLRDASSTAKSNADPSRSDAASHQADSDAKDPNPSQPLTPQEALALLRQGRPIAHPNDGFLEQLDLYHKMGCPDDVEAHPQYQRWLYQRNLQAKRELEIVPELSFIRFEDENEDEVSSGQDREKPDIEIKCRRCRRLLARSPFLVDHEPAAVQSQPDTPADCAHIFVHALSWMKPALGDSRLDGRLSCPGASCHTNVGKFAWQGLQCSCGKWETPGFGLARGKVDQIVVAKQGEKLSRDIQGKAASSGPSMRFPPGMRVPGDKAL